jgi:hypothetical protein
LDRTLGGKKCTLGSDASMRVVVHFVCWVGHAYRTRWLYYDKKPIVTDAYLTLHQVAHVKDLGTGQAVNHERVADLAPHGESMS